MVSDYIIANLPRAGLGNKLLVWARASVFAYINGLPLLVSPWQQMSIGPLVRRESQRRFYVDELRSQGILKQASRIFALRRLQVIEEPIIEVVTASSQQQNRAFVFNQVPHWSDYFAGIREYRDYVSGELLKLVPDRQLERVNALPKPVISVHVRMSDFRPLRDGEDFARVGAVRTPVGYFTQLIGELRSLAGSELPVTIFSDGHEEELHELLRLNRAQLAAKNPAIVDILSMARSKIIILSAGSTFGMWGAFMSDAAIIHHPQHYHAPVRSSRTESFPFEGPLPQNLLASPIALADHLRNMGEVNRD